jgi:hypothetical protein
MAKLQSTEIVGVANRPATICSNTMCLWFDTTTLRPMASYCGYGVGTWSAGGAKSSLGGTNLIGIQNESLSIGGQYPNPQNITEEYNGTSWSAGGSFITCRGRRAGAGTQNSGLIFGGQTFSCTEEYNGTSWSVGGALITARYDLAGAGTQNQGLAAGGIQFSFPETCTEEYNGTSWSTGGALKYARQSPGLVGVQNQALLKAGNALQGTSQSIVSSVRLTQNTEEYDGTTWVESSLSMAFNTNGAGTQNLALFTGGGATGFDISEEYNGITWTGANRANNQAGPTAGSQISAVAIFQLCTEEYNKSITIIDTVL